MTYKTATSQRATFGRCLVKRFKLRILGLTVFMLSSSAGLQAQNESATTTNTTPSQLAIRPMTDVNVPDHLGYFGDPYPIHLAPWEEPLLPQFFSGTTSELLQCERPIKAGCFSPIAVTVKSDQGIADTLNAAGNQIFDTINRNIYQTLDGSWQMAVTLWVEKQSNPSERWTVIAHARPRDADLLTPPTSWIADRILVGSLATKDFANYDGKYFQDEGILYLIYSKRLISDPVAHDGIVAQEMESPDKQAARGPAVLLAADTANGGFNSEYFHTNPSASDSFKLIETGNIAKIANKYVMTYSVGDFEQRDYKTGVAFSDTFVPEDGGQYRKILQKDTAGVWGQPEHLEVRYLLQSQKAEWPNYIADQVIGPGVPSIVQEPNGRFLLFFDGFQPGDTPPAKQDANPLDIAPSERRPFYLPLHVDVPEDGSVSAATEKELASWITAVHK
jgi:hypothetical protein